MPLLAIRQWVNVYHGYRSTWLLTRLVVFGERRREPSPDSFGHHLTDRGCRATKRSLVNDQDDGQLNR